MGRQLAVVLCVGCHPEEVRLHELSAHAAALMRPAGSPFMRHLSGRPLGEAAGGYAFEYRRDGDAVEVTVQRGAERVSAPVVWMFGSGRQGQTPVLSFGGKFVEHRVSYYAATGYGITIGQENGVSGSAKKALGREESDNDARSCFGCHATGVSRDLSSLTPGVQCLDCHAGAEAHAGGRGMPVNPGKVGHRAQVELCGTCHRLKAPTGHEEDVGNVRFQPLRLMKSACYRKGEIECTTCHGAHRDAARGAGGYSAACLGCHARHEAGGDCVGCHMPRVRPAPGLAFTDHFIRVVRD